MRAMRRPASPISSPPSCAAISRRANVAPSAQPALTSPLWAFSALITLSVMSMRGPAKTASCRIRSYFSVVEDLLDDLVGALDDGGQFLVLALVQVFLELAALALELAVLLDQIALAAAALGLGQRRRVLLQLVGGGLERAGRRRARSFSRLRELGLELGLRGLGRRGLAQHALAVDVADLQFLRPARRSAAAASSRSGQPAT